MSCFHLRDHCAPGELTTIFYCIRTWQHPGNKPFQILMKTSMCFLPSQWHTLMWMLVITEYGLNITIALYKIAHWTKYNKYYIILKFCKLLLFPRLFQLLSGQMDTIVLPTLDRWHIFTMQLSMGGTDITDSKSHHTTLFQLLSKASCRAYNPVYWPDFQQFRGEKKIKRKVSSRRTELMSVRIVTKFQYLEVILIKICCMLKFNFIHITICSIKYIWRDRFSVAVLLCKCFVILWSL